MKKRVLQAAKFVYFFTCMFLVMSSTSYAYIDPSAVTYVIQAVAGVLIAIGAACTVYRHKIMKFFRKKKKEHMKKKAQKNKVKEIEENETNE